MTRIDTTHSNLKSSARTRITQNVRVQAASISPTKSDIVARLLARSKGATIAEVSGATGWQAHSVRAFFSGLRKKGLVLAREARKDGTSCYRLVPAAATSPVSISTSATASTAGFTGAAGGDA